MSAVSRRFKRIIQRLGESFTAGGTTGEGVFTIVSPARAASFIGSTAASAAATPIRVAYVPSDDTTAASAAVAYNGECFVVQKAIDVRFDGSLVARLLVLTLGSAGAPGP